MDLLAILLLPVAAAAVVYAISRHGIDAQAADSVAAVTAVFRSSDVPQPEQRGGRPNVATEIAARCAPLSPRGIAPPPQSAGQDLGELGRRQRIGAAESSCWAMTSGRPGVGRTGHHQRCCRLSIGMPH